MFQLLASILSLVMAVQGFPGNCPYTPSSTPSPTPAPTPTPRACSFSAPIWPDIQQNYKPAPVPRSCVQQRVPVLPTPRPSSSSASMWPDIQQHYNPAPVPRSCAQQRYPVLRQLPYPVPSFNKPTPYNPAQYPVPDDPVGSKAAPPLDKALVINSDTLPILGKLNLHYNIPSKL